MIISPNDPNAMVQYAEECRALGLRYIFDPGQQCARMEGPELAAGLVGANIVICNDYEYELIREKTALDVDALLEKSEAVIITKGEKGSSIHLEGRASTCRSLPSAASPIRRAWAMRTVAA